MATAGDVPNKFDVVVNGEGYVLYDAYQDQANAPSKAVHAFSPAFVSRTNVEGNYGDDKQDFWMTFSQNDWSEGEQQRYARGDGATGKTSRYWSGAAVDITTPGQTSLRHSIRSLTFAANIRAIASRRGNQTSIVAWAGSGGNLYTVDQDGTITSQGAHGLGSNPKVFGATSDGQHDYCAGTGSVRKFDNTSVFSNFSTTGSDALEFHSNTLYGLDNGGVFRKWNTAGAASTIHTFQDAAGVAGLAYGYVNLASFGGKLLLSLPRVYRGSDLYVYGGVGVSQVARFPDNFISYDVQVLNGVAYVSGSFVKAKADSSSDGYLRPAIFYYANGSIGLLWRARTYTSTAYAISSFAGTTIHPSMAVFDGGLVFHDNVDGNIMMYRPETGGVSTIASPGSFTGNDEASMLAASTSSLVLVKNLSTAGHQYPGGTAAATSGSITSSLIDFDSSLTKLFRGIKVEFDSASDGSGGTVDIAYRVGDVDGSFTTLQSGATSGTEYTLSGVSGRAISVKVTLNKGTSTAGPVLKRVYARAAPLGNNLYHRAQYVVNLTGRNGESHIQLRDGTLHAKDGLAMATDLRTAMEATAPFNITDKFETFTGIIENLELREVRTEEFVGFVTVREV